MRQPSFLFFSDAVRTGRDLQRRPVQVELVATARRLGAAAARFATVGLTATLVAAAAVMVAEMAEEVADAMAAAAGVRLAAARFGLAARRFRHAAARLGLAARRGRFATARLAATAAVEQPGVRLLAAGKEQGGDGNQGEQNLRVHRGKSPALSSKLVNLGLLGSYWHLSSHSTAGVN